MKLALIVGTRPEYIQIEPIYSAALAKGITPILINTGQHYDYEMSDLFFKELKLPPPNYNLGIGSGTHAYQTGMGIIKLEEVLLKEKPDVCIVTGDTNSALAGALVCSKSHIVLAHNEAGLRSFNRNMPEEINRIVIDHISNINFAPVKFAKMNLEKEGIKNNVFMVGDVMYDSFCKMEPIIKSNKRLIREYGIEENKYLLLTLHRAENVDNRFRLKNIFSALSSIDDIILFPIHPRTKKRLNEFNISPSENIKIIDPVGYIDFLTLVYYSNKVLTDSGGVQKQAYFANKPCITLRDETEWINTVEIGWNYLAGVEKDKIIWAIKNFKPQTKPVNLFGDGKASFKIIEIISEYLRLYV